MDLAVHSVLLDRLVCHHILRKTTLKDQKVLYYPIRKDQKWMEILEQIEEEEENASIKIESAELPKELVEQYKKLNNYIKN